MQAAALPSAAAIRVGDIVIGRATQYKEKFNAVKGKVIAIQAQHYEVQMLEGPAQGKFHKYLHHLVTGVKPDGAPDFAPALRKRQTLSLTYLKLLTSTDLRSFPAALYSFFVLRVNITVNAVSALKVTKLNYDDDAGGCEDDYDDAIIITTIRIHRPQQKEFKAIRYDMI